MGEGEVPCEQDGDGGEDLGASIGPARGLRAGLGTWRG